MLYAVILHNMVVEALEAFNVLILNEEDGTNVRVGS